jgi:hypothetical protein
MWRAAVPDLPARRLLDSRRRRRDGRNAEIELQSTKINIGNAGLMTWR